MLEAKLRTFSFVDEELYAPYRCTKCNWFFLNENDLEEHNKKGASQCSRNIELIQEIENVENVAGVFKRKLEQEKFQDIHDIKEFTKLISLKLCRQSSRCVLCETDFETVYALEDHIQSHHGRRVWTWYQLNLSNQYKKNLCLDCKFSFATWLDYEDHLERKHCGFNQIHFGFKYNDSRFFKE